MALPPPKQKSQAELRRLDRTSLVLYLELDGWRGIGWSNAWEETPELLKRCHRAGHFLTETCSRNTSTSYCPVCRLFFHSDES